jgi:imidazolonepropionase-like amidohydrolase
MRVWLPPWYAEALWSTDGGITPANRMLDADFEKVALANRKMRALIPRLREAGVELRSGTDTFAPLLVPGDSLHEELQLYVLGGLSPEEALEIATRGSAGALGVASLGSLQVGAPADFVVYRDDPTQDLAALDSLLAVVQDGRLYTRETLDAQQARYQRSYEGFLQQRVIPQLVRSSLGLMMKNATGPRSSGSPD